MNNLIVGKIRLIHVFGFGFTILLVFFAFRWQVVEASKLAEEIAGRRREALIPSIRGAILARDGTTLAYSEPRFDLYFYTPEIQYAEFAKLQTREELYAKIQPYIKVPKEMEVPLSDNELEIQDEQARQANTVATENKQPNQAPTAESAQQPKPTTKKITRFVDGTLTEVTSYLDQLNKDFRRDRVIWYKVADGLTLEQKHAIEDLIRDKDKGKLEGMTLIYSPQRFYPENKLAASVIGYSDALDNGKTVGREGIELAKNGILEPQQGFVTYDIDATGNPVTGTTQATIQAKRGSSVETTIDKFLQRTLEHKLKEGVHQFEARAGSVVVLDPKTGEILALANYPTFDPETRLVSSNDFLGNPSISQPYEIGSVGKAFTLAAAIDSGTYAPNDIVINGHDGCVALIEGFRVCNLFERKSGPLTLTRATVLSDNVAYYNISKKLGAETMYKYLRRFGVGLLSGVDLRGESNGLLKESKLWNENDVSAYSYGTSFQMNAVQAAAAMASIPNYGVRMQPRVVRKIIDADGSSHDLKPRPVEQVMSEDSSKIVTQVLREVYKSYLIENKYKPWTKYPIAMKSGTGLIVKNGTYSKDYNATYVGFDMSNQRRFLMLLRLDSPKVGRVSSENARIVWLEMFGAIKSYLGF